MRLPLKLLDAVIYQFRLTKELLLKVIKHTKANDGCEIH